MRDLTPEELNYAVLHLPPQPDRRSRRTDEGLVTVLALLGLIVASLWVAW